MAVKKKAAKKTAKRAAASAVSKVKAITTKQTKTQIITSIGTRYAGNVHGAVPGWLTNIAAMNGKTFGLNIPPVILIWIVVAVLLIIAMRNTVYGRNLYALGGSRTAAKRLSISEQKYWVGVYTISGFIAAMTGELLLGWSGSGFIGENFGLCGLWQWTHRR